MQPFKSVCIDKLSVIPSLIPKIRYYIHQINKQKAEILTEEIVQMGLISDIESRLISVRDKLLSL